MKNVPGDVSHSSFSIHSSPSSPFISLFYISHSSFSIHSMFHSSISSHLTKFWLDRIGGCWVLVVAFRWWVSVVELNRWPALVVGFFGVCWIHLVVGFSACWISLMVRFGACWVCLVAGFRDGLFGSWGFVGNRVLVVARFCSLWWWLCRVSLCFL